jgi:hypothetical protein
MKRLIGAIAILCLTTLPSAAKPVVKICHWGGTPAAPTGDVTVTPGLTSTPSTENSRLYATGSLTGGGRCTGTMTFDGIVRAGSTCAQAYFKGKVYGLRGVARFEGPGVAVMVHEFLYDYQGDIVGADHPLLQVPQPDGYSNARDCLKQKGFTHGRFSSTVELWG